MIATISSRSVKDENQEGQAEGFPHEAAEFRNLPRIDSAVPAPEPFRADETNSRLSAASLISAIRLLRNRSPNLFNSCMLRVCISRNPIRRSLFSCAMLDSMKIDAIAFKKMKFSFLTPQG
jgi:hypothetical protein